MIPCLQALIEKITELKSPHCPLKTPLRYTVLNIFVSLTDKVALARNPLGVRCGVSCVSSVCAQGNLVDSPEQGRRVGACDEGASHCVASGARRAPHNLDVTGWN